MSSNWNMQNFAQSLRSKLEDRDDILATITALETSWNNGERKKVEILSGKLYADILEDAITEVQRNFLKDMMDGKRKPEKKMKIPNTTDQTNPEGSRDKDEMKTKATKTTPKDNVKESASPEKAAKKSDEEEGEVLQQKVASGKEDAKQDDAVQITSETDAHVETKALEEKTRNTKTFETEIGTLQLEKDQALKEVGDLKETIETKDSEMESLKETIKTKDSELENLTEKIKTKDTELENLKETMKAKDSELEKLKKEIKAVQESAKDELKKMEKEAETEIRKLEKKKERLQEDLDNTKERADKALKRLESEKGCKIRDLQETNKSLQTDLDKANERADKALKRLESEKGCKIRDLQETNKSLQTDLDKANERADKALKRLESEKGCKIRDLKEKNKRLQTDLDEANERADKALKKLESEKGCKLRDLKEKNKSLQTDLDKANERIGGLEKEINRNNLKLERSETSLQESQERNNDLATRLSKVVGVKLTHNNPNIADLSDSNRPTKIAEKYSELYDNEWTEAYESLGKNKTAEEIVPFLRQILLDCYDVCMKTADVQMQHIKSLFLHPSNVEIMGGEEEFKFSEGQENMLSNLRKETADRSHTALEKVILKKHREANKSDAMVKFIKTCTDLCWKMAVQTPPVFMDAMDRRDELFDKDAFRAYTSTGKYVEFVVWPPLYLHENGHLLSKGVAQGKKGKGK